MRGLGFFLAAVVVAALPLKADVYDLTHDNCTGTCGGTPSGAYGVITVTQNGTNTVHINVTLDPAVISANGGFVNTGGFHAFDFNITGTPTITISNLTAGWTPSGVQSAGSYNIDGFGNFDYFLDCAGVAPGCGTGGNAPILGPLDFDVTATGLTPLSFQELSTIPPGSTQAYFTADLMGTNGNTGPIGATAVGNVIPEPTSVLLLGTAALCLFVPLRRRLAR
jgi:hypothetical protein